jgi:hypothetical protein
VFVSVTCQLSFYVITHSDKRTHTYSHLQAEHAGAVYIYTVFVSQDVCVMSHEL